MSRTARAPSKNRLFQPMKTWPIRRKLVANSLITSILALFMAAVLLIGFEVRDARINVSRELTSVGEMLGNNSTASLIFNDRQSAQKTVNALRAMQRIAVAGIAKPDGSWFVAYTRSDLRVTALPGHIGHNGCWFEGNDMVLFRALIVDGELIGTVYLRSDMTEVGSDVKQFGLLLTIVMIAASLLSFVVATFLQRSIYGPVSHLASIAHEISANKNYLTRAVKTSDDELGVLVDAFNGMLDQVENRDRELEEKVAGRTAELTLANHQLTGARDRAEEATRLKSEFLANMSHEIRSPMNVIIGMTQIALDTQLTPKQNRYLSLVRNSAESLLIIINDILDFSKIEAGKMDVEAVEFRLPERITETIMPLVLKAREKGLDLQLRLDSNLPGCVAGDPNRLGQVLINLVSNAIKFTAAGQIEVAARLEEKEKAEDTGPLTVCFTVSDTGIGIEPAKQNLIFAPFRQTDGSITRRYGGTGLGLSISKCLVEMMGGRIWLESALGEGSRFHFTIAFARPVPVAVPVPAVVKEQKVRAIIVEPEEARRVQLSAMLEAWNIEAAVVNSGSAALDVMRWTARLDRPFAFALLNAATAIENDRVLLAALQQDQKMAQIPLIVIGDENSPIDRSQGLGVAACLTWPVSQSMLLETVYRFLRPSTIAGGVPEVAAAPSRIPRSDGEGLRILVAEDIPANQELILALFEKRGDSLTFANNGREAIEAYRSGTFDLILMDVQMPDIGGVEATAMIRRMEAATSKRTPIIALTAHAMKGDRERYLASGMDGYVSKPIRAEELIREVERWTSADASQEGTIESTRDREISRTSLGA
jgi:signal transduction histidine kinase/CheY-like chemotaxis protein